MIHKLKHCPCCNKDLPIAEFGIVRARAHLDGRNCYCKDCVRKKMDASRRVLKEYKTVRRQRKRKIEEPLRQGFSIPAFIKLSPVDRVRNAIRRGFHTQVEIARETKLGKDEIGDALVNLLLWTGEIQTAGSDEERVYFIKGVRRAA